MARHALVVFTDHYPYEVGDEFFEQEIDALADLFDKVVVIPMLEKEGARLTRPLPDNVTSYLIPGSYSGQWKKYAIKWLLPLLTTRRHMIETWPWRGFMRWIIDMRFASTALEIHSQLRGILSDEDFSDVDTVTFYSYWFYTGAAVGALFKEHDFRQRRPALFARAHAYDVDEEDTAHGYLPGRPFLMGVCDQVWPISNFASRQLERHCPLLIDRLSIRRLGVPALLSVPREKQEEFHIVSCSHMADYKRVDLLVDTIAELGRRGVKVHWTHIGEFMESRLEKMRHYAKSVIENVPWEMLGRMDNDQVHRLYKSSTFSVFVNTSSSEGVPVSIMEAFAAGLPVVATAAGGTEEIVHDGSNGFVVPVQTTPGEIADALERMKGLSAAEYQEMSAQALHTWETLANAGKQYSDVAHFLRGEADKRASR